ncbi:DUF1302 domain-containing protein [Burkholderia sp. Bp8963]|uniref:DUF1302 domain-containing protein n=1 Tax=Burkholderia sp. Bp8963 TaxID=2184547 RepID=UPI000F59DE73|nr:DUF1302 family protein [Burkholderia sp. Bp8963]
MRQKSRRCATRVCTGIGAMACGGILLAGPMSAQAFQFTLGDDIDGRWDNTFQYVGGMRVHGVNSGIGNNPVFNESEYKFDHAGSLVTNRLSDLTELTVSYRQNYGFRVSASLFKDFAYNDTVKSNPGFVAPGLPYSALGSYAGNRYSSYTRSYYESGTQLLDAFAYGNFEVGGHSTSVKLGRLAAVWGTAFFFGDQSISYAQNPVDGIKGSAAPGSTLKELALPRGQIYMQTDVTPQLSLAAQYFFEFEHNLLPEGGTYLGLSDFLFYGPTQLLGAIPRGTDFKPRNVHNNFGIRATWSPDFMAGGNLSFYYRRLDEAQPWLLFGRDPATGATNYHLSYNQNAQLFGVSAEAGLGNLSTGFELSYRHNTALNSVAGPSLADPSGRAGARGDTINLIANALVPLKKTPLYESATLIAELAFTQRVGSIKNADLYHGTGNGLACPTGSKWDGCATNNSIVAAMQFDPKWLQVFPGVDIDMPMFVMYGIYGNTPSLSTAVANQGSLIYTIGLHSLIHNKYNVTLQYNGYHSHTGGTTRFAPGGPSFYAGGNGPFMWNDKPWVSLTLQTTF